MTQPESSLPAFSRSDQEAEILTDLLDLLIDLHIVEPPVPLGVESGFSASNLAAEIAIGHSSQASPKTQLLTTEVAQPINASVNASVNEPSIQPSLVKTPVTAPQQREQKNCSPEDEIAALEQLQTLLVAPKLVEFDGLVRTLEQKLTNLEHQIYTPSELINLLLPWVAELLSRKVVESQEEIVCAIAPIIDRVIENRIQQDHAAMGAAIAPVISEAITQQTLRSPQGVAQAIAPSMGRAIQEQIRLERDAMVDALYPVIGSTIAKYMAEAIQAINQKIEHTFSIEGIQRKIRARLQGVSEAELILKEVLPFTIQAVFLIHKASGLIISEVQQRDSEPLEADMVAGMLTAIRSFANDCITQPGTVSELNEIDYGSSKIVLEVAGYCYLAIVIQGEPSHRFIAAMRQTLITLVQQYGQEIERFEGDPDTIPAAVNLLLEPLRNIESARTHNPHQKPPVFRLMGGLVLGTIAVLGGINHYQNSLDRQVETNTAIALASAPELAVYRLTTEAHRGTLRLTGKVPNLALRQKAEHIARTATPNWLLNNQIQAVEVPADPTLAAAEVKRLTATLNQMQGTTITAQYANETVIVRGSVSQAADATAIAQAFQRVPGVRLVSSAVQVQPLKIDVRFYFEVGSDQLQALDRGYKLQTVKAFLDQHPEKSVRIVGHRDPNSSQAEPSSLALERARGVRDALINQGVSPDRLVAVGSTHFQDASADQPAWLTRCVEIVPL